MRARLLEATVDCLVERGFAGTSTTLVSERAGVSRGAQLHHFPTKNALVVAAVEHLTEVRGAELAAAAADAADRAAPHPRGAADARRPLHLAGLHRRARALGRGPHRRDRCSPRSRRSSSGSAARRTGSPSSCSAPTSPGPASASWCRPPSTWSAGLGLANTITDDARRRGRILDHWADTLDDALQEAPHDTCSTTCSTDLKAEGDQLWNTVSGLDDGRAGRRRPRPPAGTSRTQVAHLLWTDEVAVARRHRQGGVGRGRAARRSATRPASSTPPRTRSPGSRPQALLARWGAARERARRALRELPDGPEDAVVRPADVAGLDGDRPVHGDLGARARRVRRPRRRPRAHRPDPARRPPRRPHPQLRVRGARARRRRPRSSGSS